MNWVVSIFKMANSNWTSRIFTLVLIALLTYSLTQIFKAKGNSQIANCEQQIKPYQEQVKILSQTLEQVSRAVDALTVSKPTSSIGMTASIIFAVARDTAKPRMSQSQQQSELIKIKKVLDSTKKRVDSIDKIIKKQKT